MGIVSRLFPTRDETSARRTASTDWIDLTDYATNDAQGDAAPNTRIRFAELRALEDLKTFSTHVYDGSILVIDFTKVKDDEITLRRLTNELRKLAADTGGDLAGLGGSHILVTPGGIKVDRQMLTTKESDAEGAVNLPGSPMAAPRRTNGARR